MEKRRFHRIAITSLAAVTLALGGFAVGYARTQEVTPDQGLPNAAFLGRIPSYSHLAIVRERAKELKITPDELAEIENKVKPHLDRYQKAQRTAWLEEVRLATLKEEGKLLSSTGRSNVGGYAEFVAMNERTRPLETADSEIASLIFDVIGQQKNNEVIKLSGLRRQDRYQAGFEIAIDPARSASLGLTEAQQNQLILLQAYWAYLLENPNRTPNKSLVLEEVLPDESKNRAILKKASKGGMISYYSELTQRLSPLQELRLEALVNDKVYVRP